jgi:hypothetical protein
MVDSAGLAAAPASKHTALQPCLEKKKKKLQYITSIPAWHPLLRTPATLPRLMASLSAWTSWPHMTVLTSLATFGSQDDGSLS